MTCHDLSFCTKISVSQKLPAQLERKIEALLTRVRACRTKQPYPYESIVNMDETPWYLNIVPGRAISKGGPTDLDSFVWCWKQRLTAAGSCTANGEISPAVAIFTKKRRLKLGPPKQVQLAVQVKGWMDSELMMQLFWSFILLHNTGRPTLLTTDPFSAH